MNQFFLGLCPLCFKPVEQGDDKRLLKNEQHREFYHADCLTAWVRENSPSDADTQGTGMTILQQQKSLFLSRNEGKRERWIASRTPVWEAMGGYYKQERLKLGISLRQAAQRMGMAHSTLRRFEEGEGIVRPKMIMRCYEMLFELHKLKEGTEAHE